MHSYFLHQLQSATNSLRAMIKDLARTNHENTLSKLTSPLRVLVEKIDYARREWLKAAEEIETGEAGIEWLSRMIETAKEIDELFKYIEKKAERWQAIGQNNSITKNSIIKTSKLSIKYTILFIEENSREATEMIKNRKECIRESWPKEAELKMIKAYQELHLSRDEELAEKFEESLAAVHR